MVNERYEYLLENFTKQELIERVMELEDELVKPKEENEDAQD